MGGYPGYAEYKYSGVEWLGEIPTHWDSSLVKHYYDVQLGKMLQTQSLSEDDEEVDYLKALNVQWETVNVVDLPRMWVSPREKQKSVIHDLVPRAYWKFERALFGWLNEV